jgi:ketosteroid isomerase-like protein
MTTQQIADRLVELCRKNDFEQAQKELFSEDAVSIEPEASPDFEKETKGLAAITEKGKRFSAMVEKVHGITISDPLVAGNSISISLDMDTTMKGQGRMNMTEICVYKVKDGKIISEQFFM